MTPLVVIAATALRLVQPMCEADTRPALVVEPVRDCAGRARALGCFRAETDGEPWKLNNSFTSRYARLLSEQEPELAGVFETRCLRSQDGA